MAAAQKMMTEAMAIATASEQKMKDVTTAMAAVDKQMVAQQDLKTRTENAVPSLKAAVDQAKAALTLLSDNTEIKASTESLAAIADRQEKALPAMTEQIAAMGKQIEGMKAEVATAEKTGNDAKTAMAAADQKVKALAAEMAPIEGRVKAMQTELAAAEEAVNAASGVVESRRQLLRPLLQLTSVQ
jgi:chromosome segregation ATPase